MHNFMVSPHWSFNELTTTRNHILRMQNRIEAHQYIETGKVLAHGLLEPARCGRPLITTSGFRGESLNSTTQGSSPKSQHRLFQAADVCRPDEVCWDVFEEIMEVYLSKKVPFGQLIYEEVPGRDDEISRWIHISLGPGYRTPERCGEILKRIGDDWSLVKKVDCLDWKLPEPEEGW